MSRSKLREIKEKYHYRNKDLARILNKNEYYIKNLLAKNCAVPIPKKFNLIIKAFDNTKNIVEFEDEISKLKL